MTWKSSRGRRRESGPSRSCSTCRACLSRFPSTRNARPFSALEIVPARSRVTRRRNTVPSAGGLADHPSAHASISASIRSCSGSAADEVNLGSRSADNTRKLPTACLPSVCRFIARTPMTRDSSPRSVEYLDADIAVADVLLGEVTATVDLERDAPRSGCRRWVSVQSLSETPSIQVVTRGGLPTIRARSSCHWPCFHRLGDASGAIRNAKGASCGVISVSFPWMKSLMILIFFIYGKTRDLWSEPWSCRTGIKNYGQQAENERAPRPTRWA